MSEIDDLVRKAVFGGTENEKSEARNEIWQMAEEAGIWSASIQDLYDARGRGEISGYTTPAINLRGMAYDSARAVFQSVLAHNVGIFVFELARSEIGYTFQDANEYATVLMAAAVREGFKGPIFIQGDHFQVNAKKFHAGGKEKDDETQAIKDLITSAIKAGYRNIDIDASTIVLLDKPTVKEQQRDNFTVTAELAAHVRKMQPEGMTISIGGEIGEVGKKNSTPEEFRAYMDGFLEEFGKLMPGAKGISKVSVQTGTTHGGIPLPDGSIAEVKLDFNVLKDISAIARKKYGMAGTVQHGASTLPAELFDEFPKADAAEVHLATEFQNILFDHPAFPSDLKQEIYTWIDKECADERKPDMTEEQFHYKTRKKAWGPFKSRVWNLSEDIRSQLRGALRDKFDLLFKKLKVVDSRSIIEKYIHQ